MDKEMLDKLNAERKGKTCALETTPWCDECGGLFEIPLYTAQKLTRQEAIYLFCDDCGTRHRFETEIVFTGKGWRKTDDQKAT